MNFTSNGSILSVCDTVQQFDSMLKFFDCLGYYIEKYPVIFGLVTVFALATFFANIAVFVLITRMKNKSIFDLIFRAHTLPDAILAITVIPSYGIYTIFNYWPLNKAFCLVYVSLDYGVSHASILHTLYVAYVRYRSLVSPLGYQDETLVKHTHKVIVCLWITSLSIWLPQINVIMNNTFEVGSCYYYYDWYFIFTVSLVVNLLPICIITGLTLKILYFVWQNRQKRKAWYINKTTDFSVHTDQRIVEPETAIKKILKHFQIRLSVSGKLGIILITFLIFWLPYCIAWIVNSSCNCLDPTLYVVIYWSTYIQSLANPVLLLILNENYYH